MIDLVKFDFAKLGEELDILRKAGCKVLKYPCQSEFINILLKEQYEMEYKQQLIDLANIVKQLFDVNLEIQMKSITVLNPTPHLEWHLSIEYILLNPIS